MTTFKATKLRAYLDYNRYAATSKLTVYLSNIPLERVS